MINFYDIYSKQALLFWMHKFAHFVRPSVLSNQYTFIFGDANGFRLRPSLK
jgi:hypothetical protein